MSDRDDQDQITEHLGERLAKRREEFQLLEKPPLQTLPQITTSFADVRCGCGREFTQTTMTGGGKEPIVGPKVCGPCRGVAVDEKEARTAEGIAEAKAAAHDKAVKRAIELLDAPKKYAAVSLESFVMHGSEQDKKVQLRFLNFARRFLADFPDVKDFTVFSGGYGTGKGHIAWSICHALARQGYLVRNVKLGDLVRSLRETWGVEKGAPYSKVLAGYVEVDLMVIDEVSRHAFYGDKIHQHLYDVIDSRIDRCLPTILTSNESDAGLGEIIRPALYNRLQGEGGVVDFGTASWRSKEAA